MDFQRRFNRTQSHEVGIDELIDTQLYQSGIFGESPESYYERKERYGLALKALNLLKPEYRNIIVLIGCKNMKVGDAADSLGITHTLASWRMHQARIELKLQLDYLLSNGVSRNGDSKESKRQPDLGDYVQYEPVISHSQSVGEVFHGNGHNGSPLTGKGKVYYLQRPSRQLLHKEKYHGPAKTLKQSVANL